MASIKNVRRDCILEGGYLRIYLMIIWITTQHLQNTEMLRNLFFFLMKYDNMNEDLLIKHLLCVERFDCDSYWLDVILDNADFNIRLGYWTILEINYLIA